MRLSSADGHRSDLNSKSARLLADSPGFPNGILVRDQALIITRKKP
jgi:hypothetical protein